MSCICEVCGKEYEPNEVWRSKVACCPDCYIKRQAVKNQERKQKRILSKTYTCKICGKEYHVDRVWRSKITCSKECNKVRCSQISRKYWSEVKDGINERPAFIVRYEHRDYSKNTLAEINDAARSNGMTYGQMQAYLYTLKHPLITRRKVNG